MFISPRCAEFHHAGFRQCSAGSQLRRPDGRGLYAINACEDEPDSVSGLQAVGPSQVDLRFAGFSVCKPASVFDCGWTCLRAVASRSSAPRYGAADWPFFSPSFRIWTRR
jgi:hypothetical protein